jgi:hypothetical protein
MRLISVVVFRFRQKGVKLSRSGVSLKLAVPSGCIEFRKPAPELRQVRGGESFDSLPKGFHIGHGLSVRFTAHQSDANRLASPPPSNRQRRCTAKQQPGNHAAGISRSSRFPSIGPDTDFRTIDFDLIPEGLLERCTIDLAKGTVGTERLSEVLSCRYGWMAVAERETGNDPLQAIKKLDLVNGERKVWSAARRGLESEPVLVPRSMPVGSPEPAEDGGLTPLQC